MRCSRCGSEEIAIQLLNEVKLVTKHKGILWWLIIGWWWIPIKWLIFTVPALIIKLIKGKKYKSKNIQTKYAVCQKCGFSWKMYK